MKSQNHANHTFLGAFGYEPVAGEPGQRRKDERNHVEGVEKRRCGAGDLLRRGAGVFFCHRQFIEDVDRDKAGVAVSKGVDHQVGGIPRFHKHDPAQGRCAQSGVDCRYKGVVLYRRHVLEQAVDLIRIASGEFGDGSHAGFCVCACERMCVRTRVSVFVKRRKVAQQSGTATCVRFQSSNSYQTEPTSSYTHTHPHTSETNTAQHPNQKLHTAHALALVGPVLFRLE